MRIRRALAAGLLGGAVATRTAAAQMTQCSGVSSGSEYKVLVDEVKFAGAGASQSALSVELILTSVQGALEKVRRNILKGATAQATVVYLGCTGRHPTGESEFQSALVKLMAANHAILELWGTVFPLGGDQYRFDVHYVMFPVASLTAPPPSGIAATQRTMTSKPTPQQVQAYLTATRSDLPIYFTIAAGVQAYADRRWEQALRYLCEGRARLKTRMDQQELMTFASDLASKAALEMRKSSTSVAALLTSEQASDYCTFATTR
jgi:hypothetical protein